MFDRMSKNYTGFSGSAPRLIRLLRGKNAALIELILLFTAFYLPGYLFQSTQVDPGLFNNAVFHLLYQIQTLPLILLLLYILSGKGDHWWIPYHLTRFRVRDLVKGVLTFLGIWALLLPFFIILGLFLPDFPDKAVGIPWHLDGPGILPLVALTCLTTGYWEELFFRAYLDGQLRRIGTPPGRAALAGVLLFAAGHLYQGLFPALGTAVIGAVLLYSFRRTRSLHAVAIGHGMYNFSVLAGSLFSDFG
jgi:CAAX protease family protein